MKKVYVIQLVLAVILSVLWLANVAQSSLAREERAAFNAKENILSHYGFFKHSLNLGVMKETDFENFFGRPSSGTKELLESQGALEGVKAGAYNLTNLTKSDVPLQFTFFAFIFVAGLVFPLWLCDSKKNAFLIFLSLLSLFLSIPTGVLGTSYYKRENGVVLDINYPEPTRIWQWKGFLKENPFKAHESTTQTRSE